MLQDVAGYVVDAHCLWRFGELQAKENQARDRQKPRADGELVKAEVRIEAVDLKIETRWREAFTGRIDKEGELFLNLADKISKLDMLTGSSCVRSPMMP